MNKKQIDCLEYKSNLINLKLYGSFFFTNKAITWKKSTKAGFTFTGNECTERLTKDTVLKERRQQCTA